MWHGRISPRHIAVLIAALPIDSATARAVHGPAAAWTLTDHLLATVADRLAVMSWQLGGNRKAPYPKPIPRPGIEEKVTRYGRTTRPPGEVVAYLRQWAPAREEEVSCG